MYPRLEAAHRPREKLLHVVVQVVGEPHALARHRVRLDGLAHPRGRLPHERRCAAPEDYAEDYRVDDEQRERGQRADEGDKPAFVVPERRRRQLLEGGEVDYLDRLVAARLA